QVRQVVPTHKTIRGKQGIRADDARVSRRHVECRDVLVLRLRDLIVGVRNVESGVGRLDIQMNRVGGAGTEINPVEERDLVADVVKRFELRRIEESVRSEAGQRQEVAHLVRACPDVHVTGWTLEGGKT